MDNQQPETNVPDNTSHKLLYVGLGFAIGCTFMFIGGIWAFRDKE